MPSAPPWRTRRPLSIRPFVPRLQTTTLPVAAPAARSAWQSASSLPPPAFGSVAAMTTGVADEMPLVSVTPGTSSVAPPSAVRWSVEPNERGPVEAPIVFVHGPPWSEVLAPGPLLPAEALTVIPAFVASRNASSTASVYGEPPPEIEKLITLTPSVMACCTADTESELKQPPSRQTRYWITRAPGATPQTGPRSTP